MSPAFALRGSATIWGSCSEAERIPYALQIGWLCGQALVSAACPNEAPCRRHLAEAKPAKRIHYEMAARAYEFLVEVYFFQGKEMAAAHAAVGMLNASEVAGDPAGMALGYANFAGMASVVPLHAVAKRYRQRALGSLEFVEQFHANIWGKIVTAGSMLSVGA